MKRNTVIQIGLVVAAGILLPIGLLVSSAVAQPRPTTLSDSEEPGSVIVFPKFIRGVVTPTGLGTTAKTEIAVSVVCPKGATCFEGQKVKIRFHWVCGGDETDDFFCQDTDFDVQTTVNGTAVFGSERVGPANVVVPLPPCSKGYLIGWVENTADQPIKYDGLIGNAVLREAASAVSSYNGIPIQADPALANGALITLTDNDGLAFDGEPGHYQAVTGVIYASVAFDKPPANTPSYYSSTVGAQNTLLTLLTLDTLANRPNYPTFVDLNFYNSQEVLTSTSTSFVCWESVKLSKIDGSLTQSLQGARKGSLVSDAAEKVAFGGIDDTDGPVTLLGLVETLEGPSGVQRSYSNEVWNDSVPVPTVFVPN